MIEPWITAWSYLIYKLLHHEATDTSQLGWDFESTGPLSGANQALPWIVFKRDRVHFERTFSGLRIEAIRPHTPLRYLESGGLSHKATGRYPGTHPWQGWKLGHSLCEKSFPCLLRSF